MASSRAASSPIPRQISLGIELEAATVAAGTALIPGAPARRAAVDRGYLGLNPLAIRLIAAQAVLAASTALLFRLCGLTMVWTPLAPTLAGVLGAFLAGWLYFFRVPGRPHEWKIADTLFAFVLMLQMSHICAIAQYPAAALNMPTVDAALATADRWMGVHVPDLAAWTWAHPSVSFWLNRAYFSLLPQFILAVPLLGLLLRDRAARWEYLFHFHFCAVVTVLCLALFPAACAFTFYGFESTIDQTRFITHFLQLRSGEMTRLFFNDLEGLVSMPSFHAAGALMVTWAFRRYGWFLVVLVPLNVTLIAATFMSGAHYVVDSFATVLMFVVSVAAYRRWARPLVEPFHHPERSALPRAAYID